MKGIVLAAGLGTRLYPVTKVVNKHILPVYNLPMFFWPIKNLIDSGIKDIAVVSGPPFGKQIKKLINDFSKPSYVNIKYILQEKPFGMPDAINKCKNFAKKDSVIVFAGDNYYDNNFLKEIKIFRNGSISFLRKVKDPQRFGVPMYKSGKLIKIIEKPKKFISNWIISGPHLYDNNVFEHIKTLTPSKRNELEITELNNMYLNNGNLKLIKRFDYWNDLGTFKSLVETNKFLFKKYEK